ncbi:SDR family oxidoreductase [Burkholderia cenocepacia]|nr:SDR family oxidoreductase [Burkholderia cenocepacia]
MKKPLTLGPYRNFLLATLLNTASVNTEHLHLHVESEAFLADRPVPRMPADGRDVMLGSRTTKGATTRSQYAATKSALVGLARSCAAELAPKGITVTPSRRTRRTRRSCEIRRARQLARSFHRSGDSSPPSKSPHGPACFLLRPDGSTITGQQIVMRGGTSP